MAKDRASLPALPHLAGGKPAQSGDYILERRHRLVRRFAPRLGGTLLDFGCGNGAQTFWFVGEFDRIIGVDIEEQFVAEFQTEIDRRGWSEQFQAKAYDGNRLPLAESSMDAAISFEVLEHVPDERASLAEIQRVLKPGGWLVITVPNRWWIFETHGADLPVLPWNRIPFFSWLPTSLHDRWARARIYRRRQIVRICEEAGFDVQLNRYVTAPLDVLKFTPLRDGLRATMFKGDTTPVPFQATAVLVVATKPPAPG